MGEDQIGLRQDFHIKMKMSVGIWKLGQKWSWNTNMNL